VHKKDEKYLNVLKEEIIEYSNTSESNIGHSTPVWMYSQRGASPTRVLDLSGNVWEWQANYYDKDNKYPGLRGGSWVDDASDARVSLRYNLHPNNRLSGIGFRVVVSLPNG